MVDGRLADVVALRLQARRDTDKVVTRALLISPWTVAIPETRLVMTSATPVADLAP